MSVKISLTGEVYSFRKGKKNFAGAAQMVGARFFIT